MNWKIEQQRGWMDKFVLMWIKNREAKISEERTKQKNEIQYSSFNNEKLTTHTHRSRFCYIKNQARQLEKTGNSLYSHHIYNQF